MHHLQGVVEVEEAHFEADLEVEHAPVVAPEATAEVEGVATDQKERRRKILKSMDLIEGEETGEVAEGDVEEEGGSIIRNH